MVVATQTFAMTYRTPTTEPRTDRGRTRERSARADPATHAHTTRRSPGAETTRSDRRALE